METMKNLFDQLTQLLADADNLQQLQELNCRCRRLYCESELRLRRELHEVQGNVFFLDDMPADTQSHLFGQCGEQVYWKICDRILHIDGTGPMWDFDSDSDANHPLPLWCGRSFERIVIYQGVTEIGTQAFLGVEAKQVFLAESVKRIGQMAFFNAHIQRLTIPDTVQTVEEGIFGDDACLEDTLILSASIADIRPYAFYNRDYRIAENIILTGRLPEDLTALRDSCLFDHVLPPVIHYPAEWDLPGDTFYDRLVQVFSEESTRFRMRLRRALRSYDL